MTTPLKNGAVSREAALRHKGRAVIVTISPATKVDVATATMPRPEHIEFRLKGTQQTIVVPLADVFAWAQRRQW